MWCDRSNVSYLNVTVCVFYCRTLSIWPSTQFPQDQLMVNKEPLQRHTINRDSRHTEITLSCVGFLLYRYCTMRLSAE